MRKNSSIRFRPVERSILRRAGEQVGLGWTTFVREAALLRAQQVLTKRENGSAVGDIEVDETRRVPGQRAATGSEGNPLKPMEAHE